MKLWKALFFVVMGTAMGGYALAAATNPDDAIKQRIAPIGKVCTTGEKCGSAAAPAKSASSGPRTGKEIYTNVCSARHGTGALGAPKFGNKQDWAPRIAKGLPTLYQHALNGFNKMPPHGTCSNCSEQEIKNAVNYMTDNSK